MRKLQKSIFGILCLTLLLLMTSTAFATATPYASVIHCPKCPDGSVTVRIKTVPDGSPTLITHGMHQDLSQDYKKVYSESCDTCDYRNSWESPCDEISIYCPFEN